MMLCAECGSPAEAMLCDACRWQLAQALGDLPSLLAALQGVAARQARRHRTIGAPREPEPDWRGGEWALIRTPWALDVDAAAELDRIGNELGGWVKHLCESRGIRPGWHLYVERNRMRVFAVDGPIGIARWLHEHIDTIAQDEAASEILTEISQHRADLMRAVDNSPSPLYAGPCHAVVEEPGVSVRNGTIYIQTVRRKCEQDLYAWINPWGKDTRDDAKIVCRGWRSEEDGCGTVHTAADRQDWLLDSVEDALLPLRTWQRGLPKMVDSLTWPHRAWWTRLADVENSRRVVLPKSVVDGVELFRGGDLVDHVRREQKRIAANIAARARAKLGRMAG